MVEYIGDFSDKDQEAFALLKTARRINGPVYYKAVSYGRRWFLSRTRKDRYVFVTLWGEPVVKGHTITQEGWETMMRDSVLVQDTEVLPYAARD